jgi:hypothetical protein
MIGTHLYASHACFTSGQEHAKATIGYIAIIAKMQHVFMLLFDTEKVGSDHSFVPAWGRKDALDLILVNTLNMSTLHFL